MAKRFGIRFSIRTLLIGIALVAILCGLFGTRSMHAVRDRQVAFEIRRLGGRFDYANHMSVSDLPWYSRLITLLVYEEFSRITHVSVDGTAVTDEELAHIASLSDLQGIDISNTAITDVGLDHLAKTRSLRYVNAHNTKLTERFVDDLRKRRRSLVVDWQPALNATGQTDASEAE